MAGPTSAARGGPGLAALGLGVVVAAAALLLVLFSCSALAGSRGGVKTPKRVSVAGPTSSSLQLRWKDNSRNERFFQIKISPGGRSLKAARNTTQKTIRGLEAATTYSLRIRACKNARRCSHYAKRIRATTAGEPTPAPGKRPLFGFNESIEPGHKGNALLSDSGADFVRIPVGWASIQPGLLSYNWEPIDSVAAELERRGLKPLWVVSSAPCWAQLSLGCDPKQTAFAPNPLFYGAYADFVVKLAQRYPKATGIQIWNEPNIPKFWRPAPDAGAYRALLTQTLRATAAAGIDVPIVFGAPSPVDAADARQDPTKIPTTTFLSSTLGGGVPGLDAVALHPYSFNQPGDHVARSLQLFDQAAAVLGKHAPGVPVWVTEVGFTTAGKYGVSKRKQADSLTATYRALVARGVELITVHRFFDDATPPFPFEAGMGVVAADQKTPKPAYCAIARLRGERPSAC